VEAERSCSRADGGRIILSPGSFLEDGATVKTPVQLSDISSVVIVGAWYNLRELPRLA
jgi:hypothetical protein